MRLGLPTLAFLLTVAETKHDRIARDLRRRRQDRISAPTGIAPPSPVACHSLVAVVFNRNLARTITLTIGAQLKTLADARAVVLDVFGSVNARSGHLDHVNTLLFAAADSGNRDDIAAATDALERILRHARLM